MYGAITLPNRDEKTNNKSIEQMIADQETAYRLRESKALLAWSNSFLSKRKLTASSIFTVMSDSRFLDCSAVQCSAV